MAAVSDWHGRIVKADLNLRGSVPEACSALRQVLNDFDYKAASIPPAPIPKWAEALVKPGGAEAMAAVLESAHPAAGKGGKAQVFADLEKLYKSLDSEGRILAFCTNYCDVCAKRAPAYSREFKGHDKEADLLKEMTFAKNDGVKFKAIETYGRFGPLADCGFFEKRAAEKERNSNNPNVVLCNCLEAVGLMAARFTGIRDRGTCADFRAIIGTLPFLVRILDTEGRNNGACNYASGSIRAIVEATGAPEGLEAYIHNFKAPASNDEWMKKHTAKYHEQALTWISAVTAQDMGADFDAWSRWFASVSKSIFWDRGEKRFIVDAARAKAYRAAIAQAERGK